VRQDEEGRKTMKNFWSYFKTYFYLCNLLKLFYPKFWIEGFEMASRKKFDLADNKNKWVKDFQW